MKGILGIKVGMTQTFTKEGKLIPVTVVKVEPNVVTQKDFKELLNATINLVVQWDMVLNIIEE